MALQTNVLRDGEWVTQTVDLHAVLKASAVAKPMRQRFQKPPKCGIITRTVVESPMAHLILPVRLRSAQHSDVAFIGDHFVHIRELRRDGQLHDIIYKNDFGDRIRNAKAIGSLPDESASVNVKSEEQEDDDVDMLNYSGTVPRTGNGNPSDIAPQMLLVVLERGTCIFMVLRTKPDGELEFVTSQVDTPHVPVRHLGFHLAVDPSSRYVAVGCSQELFVVYELEDHEVLNERYRRNADLKPVRSKQPRIFNGIIHKMDFLFPRREDDYHVILMLVIVKDGKSRSVIYEWEAGERLASVFGKEKQGHRLPVEHQMPLLLIPLTVRTAFLAVYPDKISVGKDVLVGAPNFDTFKIEPPQPSDLHHGRGDPLWAAWTRPYRLAQWTTEKDNVYLAREDGVVMLLVIDSDNILGASQKLKALSCNISTAFCSLYDAFADILIVGGDSGPGAIYELLARQDPKKRAVIPNWSPAVDFVTTDEFAAWDHEVSARGNKMVPWFRRPKNTYTAPDRIFAASGRGLLGTLTEYRHGLQASIGLEFDCALTTTHAWLLPAGSGSGYYMLMSMPDQSTVWELPPDLSEVIEPSSQSLPFDLSSRTIAVARSPGDIIVQVTENYIVCVSSDDSVRTKHAGPGQANETAVSHAAILDDLVVLSKEDCGNSVVELVQVGLGAPQGVSTIHSVRVDAEVTCLSLVAIRNVRHVLIGTWKDGAPSLSRFSLDGTNAGVLENVPLGLQSAGLEHDQALHDEPGRRCHFEAFTSVVCVAEPGQSSITFVLGTRDGAVITVTTSQTEPSPHVWPERFGLTAATASATRFNGQDSVFVCCDSALFLLTDLDVQRRMCFKTKHRVWPVDAQDASKPVPPVLSVVVLDDRLSDDARHTPILLAAGPQLLMAALLPQPRQVQRSIPLHGTPLKMMYSHHLECLVVAVNINGAPTLKFIDPDTGEDLAKPTSKTGDAAEFISGLGQTGDVIHGLSEWVYRKEGNTWCYILVSTQHGQMLVVSTEADVEHPAERDIATEANEALRDGTAPRSRRRIRYWTRFKRKGMDPVYSVVGHADGLAYCTGSTIKTETLNLVEKKLEPGNTFDVRSPASALRVINNKIVALTTQDSLAIVNPEVNSASSEMTLEHVDPRSRPATHMIELSGGGKKDEPGASMLLLCDRANGLVGLWVPWQQPGRDCEVLFEAELPASVRKFRRGRTRPGWLHAQRTPEYGVLPSTPDGAEILGLCMDGSLQHFTMVGEKVLAVLQLVQTLAFSSPLVYPFTYEDPGFNHSANAVGDDDDSFDVEPTEASDFEMQIDGDMLCRCLKRRCLKELFAAPGPRLRRRYVARLARLLNEVDGGKWTAGLSTAESTAEEDEDRYFELVYDIIEYYVAPVL